MTRRSSVRPAWLNRNVLAMGATSFLSDLSHEMATVVLPAFLASLGMGAATLGLIEGVADGVSSFVKLGAGWLSDRRRNRKMIPAVGYALTGVSKALFAFAHGWPLILVGRIVAWLGRGIRGPVRDAMLADSVPHEFAGRAFGFHRAGDTLGAVVGPLTAVLVLWLAGAHDRSYRLVFLLTLVPGLAAALLFARAVREPAIRRPREERPPVGAGALSSSFRRFLWAAGLFGLADFAPTLLILRASEVLAPVTGTAVAATTGMALYTLRNVVYAVASYPIGALSDRFGRRWMLVAGYALLVPVALGAAGPAAATWFLATLFVVSGLVAAAQDSLEGAIAADLLPATVRGIGYGALSTVNGIGDFASSALVGLLWSRGSAALAFGCSAGLALAGAIVMAVALAPRSLRAV